MISIWTADLFLYLFLPVILAASLGLTLDDPGRRWAAGAACCPVGLGLSNWLVSRLALRRLQTMGISLRSRKTLENLAALRAVFFSKTGALTEGDILLKGFQILPESPFSETEFLSIVASVEASSDHPIAQAVLKAAKANHCLLLPVENFKAFPGYGVGGLVQRRPVVLGAITLVYGSHLEVPEAFLRTAAQWEEDGDTVVFCGWETRVRGILRFSDPIRKEGKGTVEELKGLGIRTRLFTGDSQTAADKIARALGIEKARGHFPAERKSKELEKERTRWRHPVAYVARLPEEASVLEKSDIGINLAPDQAPNRTDVQLQKPDLTLIPRSIAFSRKVRYSMIVNLLLSVSLSLPAIFLAGSGRIGAFASLIILACGSMLVWFNSMRAAFFK